MLMGRSSAKNGSDLRSTYFPGVGTHTNLWNCCAVKNMRSCTDLNCASGAWNLFKGSFGKLGERFVLLCPRKRIMKTIKLYIICF